MCFGGFGVWVLVVAACVLFIVLVWCLVSVAGLIWLGLITYFEFAFLVFR